MKKKEKTIVVSNSINKMIIKQLWHVRFGFIEPTKGTIVTSRLVQLILFLPHQHAVIVYFSCYWITFDRHLLIEQITSS